MWVRGQARCKKLAKSNEMKQDHHSFQLLRVQPLQVGTFDMECRDKQSNMMLKSSKSITVIRQPLHRRLHFHQALQYPLTKPHGLLLMKTPLFQDP